MTRELDADRLERVLRTMGEEFPELLGVFDRDSEKQIATLEEALAAGDTRTARRAAHNLRSSAAWMGLERLSETLRTIEGMPKDADAGEWRSRVEEARALRDHGMTLLERRLGR